MQAVTFLHCCSVESIDLPASRRMPAAPITRRHKIAGESWCGCSQHSSIPVLHISLGFHSLSHLSTSGALGGVCQGIYVPTEQQPSSANNANETVRCPAE